MEKLMLIFLTALSLNAHAVRTGVDERVYRCVADPSAEQLGPNAVYEVHVVHNRVMTLVRLSDRKTITAKPNSSGYYIYKSKSGGGYIDNVNEDGRLNVSHQISRGQYAGNRLACTQTKVISEYTPLTKTELALQDIGENAEIANGQWEVRPVDLTKLNLKKEWSKFEKRAASWESCTWERITDRKAIIKMVEKDAYDPAAARKIENLEREPGLFEMIAYKSDNDISCSERWVWLYTSDGYKLELEYSQGD